jgi:hypothetical protein
MAMRSYDIGKERWFTQMIGNNCSIQRENHRFGASLNQSHN